MSTFSLYQESISVIRHSLLQRAIQALVRCGIYIHSLVSVNIMAALAVKPLGLFTGIDLSAFEIHLSYTIEVDFYENSSFRPSLWFACGQQQRSSKYW